MFLSAIVTAETQGWLQSSNLGSNGMKQKLLCLIEDTNATRLKKVRRDLEKKEVL
jgi:hypothetical protein